MTWLESRLKIREIIEDRGYAVFRVAPRNIDSDDISVLLTPPARDPERYPGGQVDTDYHQRLMVLYRLGDGNDDEAAEAVELAVETITDAFHAHVTLELAATATEPISWEEAFVDKYPPGGTVDFVIMVGLLGVSITKNVDVGA